MSGIGGFTWRDFGLGQRMAAVMAYRGPDHEGVWCDEHMTLAYRRLDVMDLSAAANQPVASADGQRHLIYDGEIYNLAQVREELAAKGRLQPDAGSATVLLQAYEEWGPEMVHKLVGSFAIALWDAARRRLWLVRDRLGLKPLYYYFKDGRLVFGSEIKCILEDAQIARRVNHAALYAYLGFEFIPAPDTAFENIHKLPAGHWATLENVNCAWRNIGICA